jgi:hypothetical protein
MQLSTAPQLNESAFQNLGISPLSGLRWVSFLYSRSIEQKCNANGSLAKSGQQQRKCGPNVSIGACTDEACQQKKAHEQERPVSRPVQLKALWINQQINRGRRDHRRRDHRRRDLRNIDSASHRDLTPGGKR